MLKMSFPSVVKGSKTLRVGFLPENDCAPVIMAHVMGLFRKYGHDVELHRELSWKTLQDKLVNGGLDAAHAPAMLPFLMSLGFSLERCACVSGLVLSLEGNAITVSRRLWERGVKDAVSLGKRVLKDQGKRTYAFGVPCPLGSQYSLLCHWLRAADLPPAIEVRIVTVPPSQMFPLLKLGYLDGYCASEPWNSVAVQAGVGVCVTTSALLAPMHPEKVLMVTRRFATTQPEVHSHLIAALIEACRLCEQPENRDQVCELLSLPHYVNAPQECLRPGISGPSASANGRVSLLQSTNIFHGDGVNEPSAAKADWIAGRLYQFLRWSRRPAGLGNVFRRDLFLRAQRLIAGQRDLVLEPVAVSA
jgi:ABC-type nitrate/sulfonate/bicarbonate transport system substrate-binding protein